MSKLDELIRELCPDGVEYKTLGEIGKFYGGLTGKSKKDFENGNEVFITYKNVYSNPAIDIYPNDKVKIVVGEKSKNIGIWRYSFYRFIGDAGRVRLFIGCYKKAG